MSKRVRERHLWGKFNDKDGNLIAWKAYATYQPIGPGVHGYAIVRDPEGKVVDRATCVGAGSGAETRHLIRYMLRDMRKRIPEAPGLVLYEFNSKRSLKA